MKIYLREANMQDVDLIYKWANDEDVRKNSFNSAEIPYDTHVKWYSKLLQDDSRVQLILEKEENGVIEAIGQIRYQYDAEEQSVEIGYSVDKNYRGQGYGKTLIKLGGERIKDYFPEVKKIIGKVKPENKASIQAFLKNGYTEKCVELELDIDYSK